MDLEEAKSFSHNIPLGTEIVIKFFNKEESVRAIFLRMNTDILSVTFKHTFLNPSGSMVSEEALATIPLSSIKYFTCAV